MKKRPQDNIPDDVMARYISLDLLKRCRQVLSINKTLIEQVKKEQERDTKKNLKYKYLREYAYYLQRKLFKQGIPHMDFGSFQSSRMQNEQ